MKNDSAFPLSQFQISSIGEDGKIIGRAMAPIGLTKRELFAAMAMQKIARSTLDPEALKLRAQISVAHADALIAQLEKEKINE